MKIGIVSLGCAKNLVDSEEISGLLKENGHTFVSDPATADAILINTCGFINPAKQESIDTIFTMVKNCRRVIALGCLVERYEKELRKLIPELTDVIPLHDYDQLAKRLSAALGSEIEEKQERVVTSTTGSAYVKISDGCSNNCAYCAIPLIRGRQQSKLIDEVEDEVKRLVSRGISEITLIAQDTTKYGVDRYGRPMLAELIQRIDQVEGLHWIRILYMYPDEISDEILDAMLQSSKVLPYFDIPIQHANNRLLKLMNRRGSREEIESLVNKIRSLFPEAVLRTTIIVGFPTESEEDFEELMDFVEKIKWDRLGAFIYSKEEDTSAYTFSPEVSEEISQERLARLMARQQEISRHKNEQKIGSLIEVHLEDQDALTGRYIGRSREMAPDEADGMVLVESDQPLTLGSFVPVRVTEARNYDLLGVYEGRPE